MENVPINTFGAKRRKEPESTISVQQNIGQQVAPNMSQEDDNQPSTSREAIVRRKRAEYMRMYRQRQKQKRLDEINAREQEQQLEVEAQQISAQPSQQIQLQRPIQEQSQLQQQSQLRHFQQQQSAQSQQQQTQHQLQQRISQQQPIQSQQPQYVETADVPNIPYANFINHTAAHKEFKTKFINNNFGHSCFVCDRLWYDNDLKAVPLVSRNLVRAEFPDIDFQNARVCGTCHVTLNRNKIPQLSSSNGFKYPPQPLHLPQLDIITERLVSPRLPFMQIRRLRHGQGQYGIFGQIINVPVSIDNMVKTLPRNVDDDFAVTVHIKKKLIHRSSYLQGLVKKSNIKVWLQYLIQSPLFQFYDIKINDSFFIDNNDTNQCQNVEQENLSELVEIEESLIAQQQTLLWNEDHYLCLAPAERNAPLSIMFDEHCEELSFPSIYLGQFRVFKEGVSVTPFMIASSELRRSDRRGVTPSHLLFMAMKIMRLRVRDSITIAFKYIGSTLRVTRNEIQSENYLNGCIEKNLAFLRSIPNSVYYWSQRKRDLFAMIRQLGKPTFFLTMSANEIGWSKLMRILYKLKNNTDITEDELKNMHYNEKAKLINEDPVTCAIHFNKLVNSIMYLLQSPRYSPFGNNYVRHYFKRIEFQHRGSPHAHILIWLNNAPNDAIGENMSNAINLIDQLVSVNPSNSSGFHKLQTHKHTFTCNKSKNYGRSTGQTCRFGAPFMPCKATKILMPIPTTDTRRATLNKIYRRMWIALEENDYANMDAFLAAHNVQSEELYMDILRAGITRPMVFLKRETTEKWINPFNPFILNVLKSNMDLQYITEEYSCAAYVVEYVNKTNRGISNLQQNIIKIMDEQPEFDIVEITRHLGVNFLNAVELTSQEAAWYLLRQPMSVSSVFIAYIPTCWPTEREHVRKTNAQLDSDEIDGESCDIWKENIFDKYQKRPTDLEHVTLAQFTANYTYYRGEWKLRQSPCIIRYRNYDVANEQNNYKREMVTLYLPFRDEENDVLAEHKYLQLYDDNDVLIMERRREFESSLDIDRTMEICRNICLENDNNIDNRVEEDINAFAARNSEDDDFSRFLANPHNDVNSDIRVATLSRLGAIAKKREDIMAKNDFNSLMRATNTKQKGLLLHIIAHILEHSEVPTQIFLTGPAGCGKTFVIHLLKEIYNRFSNTDNFCNAYLTCAPTGKAAVAIGGTTVHNAFKISINQRTALSFETLQQFRSFLKYVDAIIIDEVSMISAELNEKIDNRLKQITAKNEIYGGKDVFLIGDLRQLPPVRSTAIYKQTRQSIAGPTLWRSLKFYELNEVMRQTNVEFAQVLTKIGNGEILAESEQQLIETRFFTKEAADERCLSGIRLFFKNCDVQEYNSAVLNASPDKIISLANDIYCGYNNAEQLAFCRQKFHKMSLIDTGGLPYELTLVLDKPYIVTTNIDVSDGLANGAVGMLKFIEFSPPQNIEITANNDITTQSENHSIKRLWLKFSDSSKIGQKSKRKSAFYASRNNINSTLVPIGRRNSTTQLNNNKTIHVKRNHFPVIPACAMTIHKSQGATFEEVVYTYDRSHDQQLVYVALSRVTSLDGLFIVAPENAHIFHHGKRPTKNLDTLRAEFSRLSMNTFTTVQDEALAFLKSPNSTTIMTFNCQSLKAHLADLNDPVLKECQILLLSETWLKNDEHVTIDDYECCVQYKRPENISGGVAIFKNNNLPHIIHSQSDIHVRQTSQHINMIGDICSLECEFSTGQKLLLISLYISPNQSVQNIITFLHFVLLPYTEVGARELNSDYFSIPIIIGGDFNTNFATRESQPLINFLNEKLNLVMNTFPGSPTTKQGTTIDAVFSRYINTIKSRTYVSYFSYHRPILTVLNNVQQQQSPQQQQNSQQQVEQPQSQHLQQQQINHQQSKGAYLTYDENQPSTSRDASRRMQKQQQVEDHREQQQQQMCHQQQQQPTLLEHDSAKEQQPHQQQQILNEQQQLQQIENNALKFSSIDTQEDYSTYDEKLSSTYRNAIARKKNTQRTREFRKRQKQKLDEIYARQQQLQQEQEQIPEQQSQQQQKSEQQ